MPIDGLEPDEVLALRFDEPTAAEDLAAWCGGRVERVIHLDDAQEGVLIWVPTTQGPRPATLGDWIVRRKPGDFAPVSETEFVAHFRPAETPSPEA